LSHCSKSLSLRVLKSSELLEPCREWVPSEDEPERSNMPEDKEETEDREEGDDDDSDVSALA